jgi:hypothetical protein
MTELLFTVDWAFPANRGTQMGPGFSPRKGLKMVRGTVLDLIFPDGTKLKALVKTYTKKVDIAPLTIKENFVVPPGTQVWLVKEEPKA